MAAEPTCPSLKPGENMTAPNRIDNTRNIKAPTGREISCKSWLTEAPLRMLMNNLDGDVAEKPEELVVYGGIGRAARNWECYDRIVESLRNLEADETLLVQSGKPVGVFIPDITRSIRGRMPNSLERAKDSSSRDIAFSRS